MLLNSEGKLQLADFTLNFLSRTGPNKEGKNLYYVAPEALKPEYEKNPSMDIWSIGVILYQMLTGCLPFPSNDRDEYLQQSSSLEVKFPLNFSQDVIDLIKKMIVLNPEKRILIEDVRNEPWFQKDYDRVFGSSNALKYFELEVNDVKSKQPRQLDAFAYITKEKIVDIDQIFNEMPKAHFLTTFKSSKSLNVLQKALLDTLQALKATVTSKGIIYKITVPINSGKVYIRVTVKSVNDTISLVEFARVYGTNLDFMRIFKVLKQRLL